MNNIVMVTDKEGKTLLCFCCENFIIGHQYIEYWGNDRRGKYVYKGGEKIFIKNPYTGKTIEKIEMLVV